MAISVEVETVVKKEEKAFQTPHYYKHDLLLDNADCVIYGKVLDNCVLSITLDTRYGKEISWEFSKDINPRFQSYTSYLEEDEYKSSREEWESILEEMQTYIQKETEEI